DVGLGNIDDTSDISKPVSTAQQTAIDAKANNGVNSDITALTGLTTPLSKPQGGTGNATGDAASVKGIKVLTLQSIAGTGTVNVDLNQGTDVKLTLSANTTVTFTNPTQPCKIAVEVVQDTTGGWTLALPTITWLNVVPNLSTAANNVAVISLFYDGSIYLGMWAEQV
ncbi:MAG TPA: hypothetical protein ENH23_07990, partial [candidate division Zixibacteria bacterium]|nr:hypothetical protein [candidate division Zixibacteria bacterium]